MLKNCGKTKISKRLHKIAGMVKCRTMADIGTDHGHLPIYLIQSGLADAALATDINTKPLERAERNIDTAGLSDQIKTLLCDGLDGVDSAKYAACVISGMGGGLIINILQRNIETSRSFEQLLLSPQRDVGDVRRFLHYNGFKINDELMLKEKGKYYNILDISVGTQDVYDEKGYVFGDILIRKKCEILREYMKIEIAKVNRIGREEQKKYLWVCMEVLDCLSN
ncbi:MAG: class I SAM-dependent methyltransferase [Defluviitaleaceae bacterium]|nr:class I SAM-dependent methyltransferase [Defluviitaleaceae bacterium]